MSRVIKIRKRAFMGDFYAINLFGMIITYEKLSKEELNHKRIHSAQQKELLYIPFYIWYFFEWAILTIKYKNGFLISDLRKRPMLIRMIWNI